jgi:replicative DNA helicase
VNLPGLAAGSGEDAVEFVGRVHSGDLAAARTAIEELASRAASSAPRKRATIAELLADPRTLAKPRTIASGWGPFDRVQPFEALEVGTVSVLSAPPGCYKTSAMLRLARGFAEQGHRVEWLAGEMQPRTLVRRMVCQAAGIGQAALLSGATPPDHVRRFQEARARLEALGDRLEFVAAPIGFEELERAADRARVVFVDYLQLVRHPRPEVRGHERIEDAMAKIAECAQRTEAAFILASAQGRGSGEARTIDTATRGSSSIEFTVDALYCAAEPEARSGPAGFTVVFKCFKQREGERLEFEVTIDGRTGLIAEEVRP